MVFIVDNAILLVLDFLRRMDHYTTVTQGYVITWDNM